MTKEVIDFHPACVGKHSSSRPMFHPQGLDGPLMKPMAKESLVFTRLSWESIVAFDNVSPAGPDGPLTKPTVKEVVGFHPACVGKHNSF
jgi:hypothetical protein